MHKNPQPTHCEAEIISVHIEQQELLQNCFVIRFCAHIYDKMELSLLDRPD